MNHIASIDTVCHVMSSAQETTSEFLEVVVETEAEAGASGYSVVGGGERGIFVNEVLRDSPAAKHLSLQQGKYRVSASDNLHQEPASSSLLCYI